VEAALTGPDLELTVSGQVLRFPAVWLRDNCPCPDCVAPGTTQKLKDITDLPNGVAVAHTEHDDGSVAVTFAPDQHRSTFSRSCSSPGSPAATVTAAAEPRMTRSSSTLAVHEREET
jgi:uncharacterized protein DUF971